MNRNVFTYRAFRRTGYTGVMLVLAALACTVALAQQPPVGRITGKLIDAETGEALLGASVMVEGTQLGAMTDLDGNFLLKRVPVGTYTLKASMVGYTATAVTQVEVTADQPTNISLALKPHIVTTKSITVEAKRLKNNEASLLRQRQLSNSVSDAISAEMISRTGSGDAASAMTRVTGASLVDGKYVLVRGLGDRYANTRINGALTPSPDPNKQAVPMDMIPSALLDNIVVEKTFTPDKPGNFSGGSIDLTTKDMPDGRVLTFSSSATYNTQTTFENSMLANQSANDDWLALGANDRDIDSWLKEPMDPRDLAYGDVVRDSANSQLLERQSKAITSPMTPTRRTAPLNQSYAFTYGDSWQFFNMPLGVISSLTYSRNFQYYNNGRHSLRSWMYNYDEARPNDTLDVNYDFSDEQGKDEVLWGGLFSGSLRPHPAHKLGFTYVYNRSSESAARVVQGYEYNVGANKIFRSQSLTYSERILNSAQVKGDHANLPFNSRFDWMFSSTNSSQDEPDLRYFSDVIDTVENQYSIWLTYPSHYYRNLDEKNREGRLDFSLPFKQWGDLSGKFKMGGSYLHKTRDFREREFKLGNSASVPYNGNIDEYLDPANFGIRTDSASYRTPTFIEWQLLWAATSSKKANFDAEQNIAAYYAMLELPITSRLNVVGGVRWESTEMTLDQIYVNNDTTDLIDGSDALPSVSFIYKLGDNMNARVAYGRTLARPTIRELAPYASWDFIGGGYFIGNPNLNYTKIDNYDARWEWFLRPGEILAVSGFIKRFYDPIERAFLNFNGDVTAVNVDRADVYGLEIEFRSQLGHVAPLLKHFRMGGNITLAKSEVRLTDDEYREARNWDSTTAEKTRQFHGQSPYVVNFDVSYDNENTGTNFTFLFNRFGKRLSEVTLGVTPDVYEQSRTSIDLTLGQRIWRGISFKGAVRNLTNSEHLKIFELNGREYVASSYTLGRSFAFGVSYSL